MKKFMDRDTDWHIRQLEDPTLELEPIMKEQKSYRDPYTDIKHHQAMSGPHRRPTSRITKITYAVFLIILIIAGVVLL